MQTNTNNFVIPDIHKGLDSQTVEQQRKNFGRNELTPPERDPWWRLLLEKFDDPTIRILIGAACISVLMTACEKFLLQNAEASFIDSVGIFLAVLLATLVGYFSERKSAREFELLNKVKDDFQVEVVRDGQSKEISIGDVVVGDCVRLELGDKVPADGLVLESLCMQVDQSLLTGESVPVEKVAVDAKVFSDASAFSSDTVYDDTQQVYRGTMVVDGHGYFVVREVGDKTKVGQIAAHLGKDAESENETPLVHKLSILAKQISVIGVSGAMAIFSVMCLRGMWTSPFVQSWFTASSVEAGTESVKDSMIFGIHTEFFAALVCGMVLSAILYRFALMPFFASMDMKPTRRGIKLLLCVPLFVGSVAVLSGVFGIIGGEAALAVPLLKEVLLAVIVAVTIIVVAVPEGLPMMVTVSLALNMMKMAKENCLIRKLIASETIGSATVICTDKTGTLTQNKMQCVWYFFGMKEYQQDKVSELASSGDWNGIVDAIAINTEANLNTEHGVTGIGNPTECAILTLLHNNGVDYHSFREKYKRVYEMSHNSQRKMSAVIIEKSGDGVNAATHHTVYVKGAPERILEKCKFVSVGGKTEPLESHFDAVNSALKAASDNALRVIAFAEKSYDANTADNTSGFETELGKNDYVFSGFVGISDPIRPEVATAVKMCLDAGIDVKMITGDAKPTALAIAKASGILSDTSTEKSVLTSDELEKVSEDELPEVAKNLKVLARSTPMDKLRLVKALHRSGEVVAMTGDGTNDAPALKFADVGLSMGIAGTEVAKEASDIVLMDDNFKSIVTGVWWGRTLFRNIQRFLQFQLSVNVVALLCALLGPLVGVPLPFTVTQLLWINIIMDTFAAIAYSTDPPRAKTMRQQPINRSEHIITPMMSVTILVNSLFQAVILFASLYFGWFLDGASKYAFYSDPDDAKNLEALTVFFTIFVMFQFWHKFNCRSLEYDESPFALILKNKLFIVIIAIITVVQIVMVQASDYFMIGKIFRTDSLSLNQWIGITLLTSTIIPVAWLARLLAARMWHMTK
ncbi:MAG: calcium-translocating P-type ATPase, PMCA-type [Thermoguttaceae bacterium]